VKAFNTIWSEHLKSQGNKTLPTAERRAIPIAGDDPQAKQIVADLIDQIGFSPVDTGTLRESGKNQQPGTPLYNKNITAKEAELLLKK
jgi:predicted dinucleotide-binding enzyme